MIDFNGAPTLANLEDAEARKRRVASGLQSNIRQFVAYLYPRAVVHGDARIGDTMGEPGASLSICIKGEAAGRWHDHANGEKGDAFGLWASAHNLDIRRDFATILTECDAWLGGNPPVRAEIRHTAEAAKPKPAPVLKRETDSYSYFDKDGGFLFEVVRLDHYDAHGNPVLKADGKQAKDYMPRNEAGAWGYPSFPRPLYRLPDIYDADVVVFCEGEKCADAVHQCGWPATSAPGGSNTRLDAIDWKPLAGKKVILWPDNDDTGRKFMERVGDVLKGIGCTVNVVQTPDDMPEKWDAADATPAQIHALLRAPDENPSTHGLKGQWLDEIAYAYEPELVEGLIPANGVGVVYGPSSAGKSFIVVDWAVRIASGQRVLDRWTEAAGVLYFAAEGQAGLRKRLVAARCVHGLDDVVIPFNYLPALLDLSRAETGDVERLTAYAEEASQEMRMRGAPLRVVVIDTLAAAAPSADENQQRDMGPVMLAFHRMAQRLGAVVVLVAHTGKDVSRGLRGWSGIRANADFAIECQVEKDEETGETSRRSLWFEKAKDGPDGFILTDYALMMKVVGTKRSGEPDTTCFVDYVAPPKPPSPADIAAMQAEEERERMGELRSEVFEAITECLSDRWKPLRETAEILKHQGGVQIGLNSLQGFLTTLAPDADEGVETHHWKGFAIEVQSTIKMKRMFRELRVLRDE